MLKRRDMRLNHERSFFENRRNCSPSELWVSSTEAAFSEHSIAIHSISLAGYVNARTGYCLLRTPSPRGKQFQWFLKIDLFRFHRIYLLFDWNKPLFFSMCLLMINLPELCPNMIHFDAVDFSEWHSNEVISFFWRSVYIELSDVHSSVVCIRTIENPWLAIRWGMKARPQLRVIITFTLSLTEY